MFIAIFYLANFKPSVFTDPAGWPGFLVFVYLGFLIWYFVVRKPLGADDVVEFSSSEGE